MDVSFHTYKELSKRQSISINYISSLLGAAKAILISYITNKQYYQTNILPLITSLQDPLKSSILQMLHTTGSL